MNADCGIGNGQMCIGAFQLVSDFQSSDFSNIGYTKTVRLIQLKLSFLSFFEDKDGEFICQHARVACIMVGQYGKIAY